MKKAVARQLRLVPHLCPLCGQDDPQKDIELFPARLGELAFTEEVFSARRQPDKLHYRLVRCQHDGLVRSDPIAPISDLYRLYSRSQFTYDTEVELLQQTYLESLQPVLKQLSKTAHIVEIGCGNGFMLEALIEQGFKSVTGIEPSQAAVQKASKKIQSKIIQKPFNRQLFKPDSLDCILLFQTLDHIPNVAEFVEDCYSLLKPGGYLVSFHHNVSSWLVPILGESHPIIDVEHTQLFDARTSKALFMKQGFQVLQINKPSNLLSLRHLVTLLPFPRSFKQFISQRSEGSFAKLLRSPIRIKLGNLVIVGQKPVSLTTGDAKLNPIILNSKQKKLRRLIVTWSHELGLSHLGSCLSCVDIIAAIYEVKRSQDDFVLSSGHAAFGWYAVLVEEGLLSTKVVTKLSVHPDRKIENGISVSSGSLGQGLPIAVGKAIASPDQHVYCLTSDGEWSEGSMIEALRVAIAQQLRNLTIVINCNGWGAYRETSLWELMRELSAYDVSIQEVDGHNFAALKNLFTLDKTQEKVRIVFAQTTVEQLPSLSGQSAHYQVLTDSEFKAALAALK